jgi:hypothetical protein
VRKVHDIPKVMTRLVGGYYLPALPIVEALILLFFHLNPSTEVPPL